MMMSCDEIQKACNKAQYKEASLWHRLLLNIHIIICKGCAKHVKMNKKLTSLCDKAVLTSLSEKEKNEMKEKLHQST